MTNEFTGDSKAQQRQEQENASVKAKPQSESQDKKLTGPNRPSV